MHLSSCPAGNLFYELLADALHKGSTAKFRKGDTVRCAAREGFEHLAPTAIDRRHADAQDML